MKKIILVGASLNSGNRGVNALTRSEIMLLFDKYGKEVEIKIFSYTTNKKNILIYNGDEVEIEEILCTKKDMIFAYIKSKTIGDNYITKEIKSSDAVLDISEGDSFSDIYGSMRFIQHSLIKMITLNLKKTLIIMQQTMGPFNRKWVKKSAYKILRSADQVFVRDDISKKILKENLKITRDIKYFPDMAFYMEPASNININEFIDNKDSIKFGINISALLYNGGYNGKNMFGLNVDYKSLIDNLIMKIMELNNVDIILIPHVMLENMKVEDDFNVCKEVAKKFQYKYRKKIYTIDRYYREDELKAIISGCDFFVGSRMHACIGAISTFVPTAPIAYSRKFVGIWEKINLEKCVQDPKKETEEQIIDNIIKLFYDRDKIKEILNKEIVNIKKQFNEMKSIL